MKCEEVLSLIRAYADRELDPGDFERVGAHIAQCAACSERLESERELKLAIRSRARVGPAPAALASEIKRAVRAKIGLSEKPSIGIGLSAERRRLVIVGAASFLLIVFAAFWLSSSWLHTSDSQMPPSRVAVEAVDDHIRYLATEGAPQVQTSDPAEAERWFAGQLDIALNLPRFKDSSVVLRGGRLCYLLERHVALMFYERGDERLSLFVMNPGGLDLPPEMELGDSSGGKLMTETHKGYKVVCWKRYGLLFALVGGGALEALVSSAY